MTSLIQFLWTSNAPASCLPKPDQHSSHNLLHICSPDLTFLPRTVSWSTPYGGYHKIPAWLRHYKFFLPGKPNIRKLGQTIRLIAYGINLSWYKGSSTSIHSHNNSFNKIIQLGHINMVVILIFSQARWSWTKTPPTSRIVPISRELASHQTVPAFSHGTVQCSCPSHWILCFYGF